MNTSTLTEYSNSRIVLNNSCIESYALLKTTVVPFIFLLVFVIGVIGNAFVLGILGRHMKFSRTGVRPASATNVLVLNLAAADLIFLATLPFHAIERFKQGRWIFGNIGCKVISFFTLLNLYGSVFFLVMMSLDRFLAVVFVTKSRHLRTIKNAVIASTTVWLLATFIATESLVFREVMQNEQCFSNVSICTWKASDSFQRAHQAVRLSFGFFIPISIIIFSYAFIFIRLQRQAQNTESTLGVTMLVRRQHRVTKMIFTVISAFILCWLPNITIHLLILSGVMKNDQLSEILSLFGIVLGFANSCVNPILYAFMKADVREEVKKTLDRVFGKCCSHCSLHPSGMINDAKTETEVNLTKLKNKNLCLVEKQVGKTSKNGLNLNSATVQTDLNYTTTRKL